MKNTKKDLRIMHRGVAQLHNGESAVAGEAATLVNMREREQALEVVGTPRQVGQLNEGDKVLLVDDDRTLVLRGNEVLWNGVVVLTSTATVINAHRVGPLLVVVTEQGNELLHRTASGYERLDIAGAIPEMYLSAVENSTIQALVPAYEFDTPMNTWQAPLASADVEALTRLVRNAVVTAQRNAVAQGCFTGVLLARYGVRLWDDSYLWLSQPVMVGHDNINASYRSTGEVYTSNGKYAGVQAISLSVSNYRLGISIASGIASEWRSLVKAIDVLVSPQASLVDLTASVDYRCVVTTSSGTRRYLLELGPKARSASAIMQQVLAGDWRVVASTTVLDGSCFVGVNTAVSSQQVLPGKRCDVISTMLLSPRVIKQRECSSVMRSIAQRPVSAVTMEHNGRLYQAPRAFAISNHWHVLPWLGGTITAGSVATTIQVTLSTSEGDKVLSWSGTSAYSATMLNPIISFPDSCAKHIAIAVGNMKWECDLSPLEGTGVAAYISPSLSNNALLVGTITPAGDSVVAVPSQGELVISDVGNPLVTKWRATVSGCSIMALGAACRPIYSGGFGRYPIYLFTNEGIMALPQLANGAFAEPRLVSSQVLADGARPVSGGDAVWFVSQHGVLCRLSGSSITSMLRDVEAATQLAWNSNESELWLASSDGAVQVLMPSGHTYSRDIIVGNLYSDPRHALAVMNDGALLDLYHEDAVMQQVDYLSQPFEIDPLMRNTVRRIIWNLFTSSATSAQGDVTLTLRGERGSSCHGYVISRVRARGVVAAPLSRPIISHPSRTIRLAVTGTLPTGTILLPTHIYIS